MRRYGSITQYRWQDVQEPLRGSLLHFCNNGSVSAKQ